VEIIPDAQAGCPSPLKAARVSLA